MIKSTRLQRVKQEREDAKLIQQQAAEGNNDGEEGASVAGSDPMTGIPNDLVAMEDRIKEVSKKF